MGDLFLGGLIFFLGGGGGGLIGSFGGLFKTPFQKWNQMAIFQISIHFQQMTFNRFGACRIGCWLRGRSREMRKRTINKEREHQEFKSWGEAEVPARDKAAWKRRINGPILHKERMNR